MYSGLVRQRARELMGSGESLSQVSRQLSVSRSTLRTWRDSAVLDPIQCPSCDGASLVPESYAALLGFYLGDGCISSTQGKHTLRVSCDEAYPGIITAVNRAIADVVPHRRVFRIKCPGAVVVQSNWKHWPCLFPQHGPGRKHERLIRLEPWQDDIVVAHSGEFLRGLFHSDGARVNNFATRVVAGERKRYDYPRWQFVNRSDDIIDLCTAALDRVAVAWKRSKVTTVSVSRADAVRRLDALIGRKM